MKFFRKDWILYDEIAKHGGQRPDTLIELRVRTEDTFNMSHVPAIEKLRSGYVVRHDAQGAHPMNAKHHIVTTVLRIDGRWVHRYDFDWKKDADANVTFAVPHGEKAEAYSFCNLHGLYYSKLE